MKKLLLSLILGAALTGCASYGVSRFDAVLLKETIDFKYSIILNSLYCDSGRTGANVLDAELRARALVTYTATASKDLEPVTREVLAMVLEMRERYQAGNPSETYCKAKFANIDKALTDLIDTIGRKPR